MNVVSQQQKIWKMWLWERFDRTRKKDISEENAKQGEILWHQRVCVCVCVWVCVGGGGVDYGEIWGKNNRNAAAAISRGARRPSPRVGCLPCFEIAPRHYHPARSSLHQFRGLVSVKQEKSSIVEKKVRPWALLLSPVQKEYEKHSLDPLRNTNISGKIKSRDAKNDARDPLRHYYQSPDENHSNHYTAEFQNSAIF